MNILVVDDEEMETEIIRRMIQKSPVKADRIFCASSAQEARIILREYYISIMICDIEMPEENGLELTRWVREKEMELQIIYLTGYARFEYAAEALRMGVMEYLLKPVMQEELTAALQKAAEKVKEPDPGEENLTPEQIVKRAKEYIKEHYAEEINRTVLSEMFFVHADYFSHIFKEYEGVSFMDYLIDYRMNEAKRLLSSTNLSLVEISNAVGYTNTAHFGKYFKRFMGMSPNRYRKIVKNDKT